jgi:hypothetical protein
MAVTSERITTIRFSGDVIADYQYDAAENTVSPGSVTIHTLAAGFNEITLPTGGSTPKGATIIPPDDNVETLTLKGVTGDTGIALSKVDPTSISFDTSPPVSIGLTAGGIITGLRIIWS